MRVLRLVSSLALAGCSLDAIGAFEATGDGGAGGGAGSGTTTVTATATTGSGSGAGGSGELGGAGGGSTSNGESVCARRGAWLDGSSESYLEYDPGANDILSETMPSDFVFTIWLDPDTSQQGARRTFVAGRYDRSTRDGWSVYLEPDGTLSVRLELDDGNSCTIAGKPNAWPAKLRVRYVGGSNDVLSADANGIDLAIKVNCPGAPVAPASSVPFRIGVPPGGLATDEVAYRGDVDDVYYDSTTDGNAPCMGSPTDRGWDFEGLAGTEVLPAGACIGNLVLVGGATVTGVDCSTP